MIVFFLTLLLAHLAGDFLLQPYSWVMSKNEKHIRSPYLYWHMAVHTLLLLILLQFDFKFGLGMVLIIVSHFVIDLIKIKLRNRFNERTLFFTDQLMHVGVIIGVVSLYFPLSWESFSIHSGLIILTLTFILLNTVVASVAMRLLLSPWKMDELEVEKSLEKAGTYIGILERLFVFGFIILGHWQGIGFLLAAKSVFRFVDLSRARDRKLTEYILIGTLLSFGIAIITGVIYMYLSNLISP